MTTCPRIGVPSLAVAALLLVACGDRKGALDERGVWRYGITAADTRPAVSTMGSGSSQAPAAPSVAPTAAPIAAPPTTNAKPPEPPKPSPAAPTRKGAYRPGPVANGGSIRVSCRLTAPKTLPPVKITKDEDKGCKHRDDHTMESERLVYDPKTLGVGNCLVRIRDIAAGKDWPDDLKSEDRSFTIDQKTCVYVPHLGAIRDGTQVVVVNSDGADHNIHGFYDPTETGQLSNGKWNIASAPGSRLESESTNLENPGPYIVKCDIHPWMSAHIYVSTTPYYDKTLAIDDPGGERKAGEALLKDVPPGTYTIEMWHEGTVETPVYDGPKMTTVMYSAPIVLTKSVTVEAGKEALVEFVFDAR